MYEIIYDNFKILIFIVMKYLSYIIKLMLIIFTYLFTFILFVIISFQYLLPLDIIRWLKSRECYKWYKTFRNKNSDIL